ncbi:MAG TPA: lytic murein transglycosylase [Burkholderiaceae bacterium]
MSAGRRLHALAARAVALAALAAAPAVAAAASGGADPDFARCLAALRAQGEARGVSAQTFDRHTKGIAPDRSVLALLDYQPEFVTPVWDYLAALVDDERIAHGRAMLARWSDTLDAIERRFGVDRHTVVAVWGVESDYGKSFGSRPLLVSLATLSCDGRRQSFFRGEFLNALRILQEGHVEADRLVGSWAGAFGHTQFMPSSFLRLAVDFDGDGRRDVVGSVPDALASTANFLVQAGWRSGEPWGFEARVPPGLDPAQAERRNRKTLAQWSALGVRRVDGAPLAGTERALAPDTRAAVLLPAGASGPAFVVLRNFDAIFSYNASTSYGLAIAHLADRLRGGGPFAARWPTDDPGLSRAERRELQTLLVLRGHDIGPIDGMIGARTREAVVAEQTRLGFEANGRAGAKILEALRPAPGQPPR